MTRDRYTEPAAAPDCSDGERGDDERAPADQRSPTSVGDRKAVSMATPGRRSDLLHRLEESRRRTTGARDARASAIVFSDRGQHGGLRFVPRLTDPEIRNVASRLAHVV